MRRMNTIRYELDADGIATITFDAPGAAGQHDDARSGRHDLAEAAAQLVARQGADQRRAARLGEDDLLRRRGAEERAAR